LPTIFLKAESVNTKTKAPARQPDAMPSIGERHEKEKICAAIFPPNEMPALFPVQRNIGTRLKPIEQTRYCTLRRPCQGTINLYGRLRICILCNAGLVLPPNYPGARTAYPKNGGGTRHG